MEAAAHSSRQTGVAAEQRPTAAEPRRSRVLFVGDNRSAENWGRAASFALHQTLASAFEIEASIPCDLLDVSGRAAGYAKTLLASRYYGFFRFCWARRHRFPFSWYIRLEQLLGAKDLIAEDPAVTVDRLLANKHRHPVLGRLCDQAAASDFFLLDGDGDIIFTTPPRRQTLFLLAMIELGIRLKKPVMVVNSMISDCPLTGRNSTTLAAARRLFAQCAAVVLRDPQSLKYVRTEMPATHASFIPDSLFSWYSLYGNADSLPPRNGDFLLSWPESAEVWGKLRFDEPYICIGGGALAGTQPDRAALCYARLVDGMRELGYRVILTENDLPDSFLRRVADEKNIGIVPFNAPILFCGAVLANARLFISGRYHPSIFASLGGTPCIFLGSHAHKMGSLSQVLDYDLHREFSAFPDENETTELVAMAQTYVLQGESLRARIRLVAKTRSEQADSIPSFLLEHLNNVPLKRANG